MIKYGNTSINPIYVGNTEIENGYKGNTQIYSDSGVTPNPPNSLDKLKILCIGNSHTVDSWGYVPFILKQYGIDCLIVLCFHPGATLSDYHTFWNSITVDGTTWSLNQIFYIDTAKHNKWNSLLDVLTLKYDDGESQYRVSPSFGVSLTYGILGYENNAEEQILWDLICMQSSYSNTSGWLTKANIQTMFSDINSTLTEAGYTGTYKKGFTLTHAQQVVNPFDYTATIQSAITAAEEDESNPIVFDMVFPCGTVIHSMRADNTYRALESVGIYRNLFEDTDRTKLGNATNGVHLCGGIPIYAASATIVAKLFEEYNLSYSLNSNKNELYPNLDFDKPNGIERVPQVIGHNCGTSNENTWRTLRNGVHDIIDDVLANPYEIATTEDTFNVIIEAHNCKVYYKPSGSNSFVDTCNVGDEDDTAEFEVSMYGAWSGNVKYETDDCTSISEQVFVEWPGAEPIMIVNNSLDTTQATSSMIINGTNAVYTGWRSHTKLCYNLRYVVRGINQLNVT